MFVKLLQIKFAQSPIRLTVGFWVFRGQMTTKQHEALQKLSDLRKALREVFNLPIDLNQTLDDIRDFIVKEKPKNE